MSKLSIKIGVSSCLLGERVRFDAGHKKNAFITGNLADHFEFVPFCPEMSIGLGVPRKTIKLVDINDQIRCVGSQDETFDVTEQLTDISEQQAHWHQSLSGYILKRDSPSCGMERVKVYKKQAPTRRGVGIYAQRLMENFPLLPVEEEGRLEDPHLRENFVKRVFIYHRWQMLTKDKYTIGDLQRFHAEHKYSFMSHNQNTTRKLGKLLAVTARDQVDLTGLAQQYVSEMMAMLKDVATTSNHVNTLHHIQGYLKKHLDSDDKQELKNSIEEYAQGQLPLIVPITLMRHHFRKNPQQYILDSIYLNPHPQELMLLNRI